MQKVLRTDRKAAQKILSTYLNLLTVYPDQPYDQPEVVHPINGMPIVTPKNCGDFSRLFPKEERVLELVRQKAANGERVLIYTSWTRTDSQKKLQKLLCSEGYRTEILTPQIATDKREDWVNKRVKGGLQVLITNPRCVETGLDLNAFTTIIFYSMGYNLFTLRQASRRSWRINQTAPRVEVYMLYYKDAASPCAVSPVISREDISFSDYMIKWLGIIKNSVEVDTYAGYVNNVEKRIVPYFRGQRILLRELTALDVENFYSYCFNELHLKGTTVQRFHANIHKAMKYARKHDLIASNPMDNVERPKSQRYVGAFYSVSELETLFQAVKGDPCEFPVLMAAFYGLRRSEIMGLRWRAIDFESNLITIDHTVVQCMCDGTTITVEKDRTKNQSSCRSMPLVPQYRDLLLRMKVRQEYCRKLCGNCYTESEYIFVNDMGAPYQPNYVTQHFKLILRKNHLRNIRFHDLRHTCASLLLKNGVPMKDIQEWLGHSSYNTTANIYAHLDTSSKNTSASKMSNVVIIEPGISTSV